MVEEKRKKGWHYHMPGDIWVVDKHTTFIVIEVDEHTRDDTWINNFKCGAVEDPAEGTVLLYSRGKQRIMEHWFLNYGELITDRRPTG